MKILNIGCGPDTRGTHFLDKNPTRNNVLKYDAEKDRIPYEDDSFDKVYLFHIIEHLINKRNVLEEAHRVLKKDGLIYLTTDNAHYVGYLSGSHDSYDYEGDKHYSMHTKQDIERMLKDTGFRATAYYGTSEQDIGIDSPWKPDRLHFFIGGLSEIPLPFFKKMFSTNIIAGGLKGEKT